VTRIAIVGTGNIGTDLLEKARLSSELEIALFTGIDRDSPGIKRAESYGVPTSTEGATAISELEDPVDFVFEATSAAIHLENIPFYEQLGVTAIDLTPAKAGPGVIPSVNLEKARGCQNINLITCGGQATVPMVAAVSSVSAVDYAEIVSTVSSASAGPGTRQNIDEFTLTTARALEEVGGAGRGKAIIVLNPAEPPILMRNTVFCLVSDADETAIVKAVEAMAARVRAYVPGYRIVSGPEFDRREGGVLVSIFLEVSGAGDFLPPYAGNLDIMTAAAVAVGEALSRDKAQVQA
jgi:acetaldehyde dehydrogenase